MTGSTLYLGMVVAAFATFIVTLFGVSTWQRRAPENRPAPTQAQADAP